MDFRAEGLEVVSYRAAFGLELVKLWRKSFQRAMGLSEHDPASEVLAQLDYFETIPLSNIHVVLSVETTRIVAFMVLEATSIDHLYVHVDHQAQGVGSALIRRAKLLSPTELVLYTFQKNLAAQRFYEHHGFVERKRGFASLADNPWAASTNELADIQYRWVAAS